MKISLNCKLDPVGAYGFIKPISDIPHVSQIDVFRDEPALDCEKVSYHSPTNNKRGVAGHINKLFRMFKLIDRSYVLSIGIYEIPHGILAYLSGKYHKVPCVVSIIGNPGYTKLRKGLRKAISLYMYKRCQAVTVTGSKSKKILEQQGINKDKIHILPNSIDIEKFKPMPVEKQYDIMSLGRLSEEKELANFLKIIKELKKEFPGIKAAIAGKGPEESKLKNIIKESDLTENVDMLGFVDDIVELYNSSTLFLLTSHTEGLPRTILEAMACEVPCVASNVGDMVDIIDHEQNGFLVENPLNIDEYLKYVKILLNDKNLYDIISKNAKFKIMKNYSYVSATKLWEDIIKNLEKT